MDDSAVGAEVAVDARHVRVLRASEAVYGNPPPAQLATQVADVDVHPARLLTPQGSQRAGMDTDHGDAMDHGPFFVSKCDTRSTSGE